MKAIRNVDSDILLPVDQGFFWYMSCNGVRKDSQQASGAYIFRSEGKGEGWRAGGVDFFCLSCFLRPNNSEAEPFLWNDEVHDQLLVKVSSNKSK